MVDPAALAQLILLVPPLQLPQPWCPLLPLLLLNK